MLDRIIFPVGGFEKPAIRELAREAGLRVADKPDSQEICFIPDNDYAGFVDRFRPGHETAGELVDTAGNVLGRHDGYHHFTIGQRRGLGLAFGSPRFVIAIDAETKARRHRHAGRTGPPRARSRRPQLARPRNPGRFTCRAEIRYRHAAASARVAVEGERLRVQFDEPQFGVTPGQAVVLYDGDRVLGGGWIR